MRVAKWRQTAAAVCGMAMLLSACSLRGADILPSGDEAADSEKAIPITFQEGGSLNLVKTAAVSTDGNFSTGVAAAFDHRYLLYMTGNGNDCYYEWNPEKDNLLTYIGEMKPPYVGSGDDVVTNDNEYWMSGASEDGENLALYKIDVQEKSVMEVRKDKIYPPLQYYHKIDENRLLFFGPNQLEVGTDEEKPYYSYYVDVYDVEKNERQNIIEVTNLNKRISMPSIYYTDGLIYTLQSESYKGDTADIEGSVHGTSGYRTASYVRVYDIEGNLKKELELPDMTAFESQNNYFFQMRVYDNIIFISTLNWAMAAFEILPDDTVRQLEMPQGLSYRFLTKKGGEADKGYIYNSRAKSLVVYDRRTRCFTRYDMPLDSEVYYEPFLDWNGELRLGVDKPKEKTYEVYRFEEAD